MTSALPVLVPTAPDRVRKVIRRMGLGLFLDRSPSDIPEGGLSDCQNVRIRENRLTNENMGWTAFLPDPLNGPLMLIDNVILRNGVSILVFGTPSDLYRYDEGSESALFITPRFNTGTADVTNGSATVQLNAAGFTVPEIKPGDYFHAGSASQDDPSAVWYRIQSVDVGLQQITLDVSYAEATQAGVDYTARQTFSGSNSDVWSSENFPDAQPQDEDTWYATQGVRETDRGPEMVKWNAVDPTVTRFDPGFAARALIRFKDQLIYGDIIESTGESKPYVFKYSAASTPETIDGELNTSEGVDDVLAFRPLGDVCVSYNSRSFNLLQFVGPPTDWVVRTVISSAGAISSRSIADFGDFHDVLTEEGLQRFDGVTLRPLSTQVFRSVTRQIDASRAYYSQAHISEENGEVYYVVPLASDGDDGGPLFAFTFHYLDSVGDFVPVMKRQLPATAMGFFTRDAALRFSDLPSPFQVQNFRWNDRFFGASFPVSLFGDDEGNVFELNSATSLNAGAMTSFVKFGRLPALNERKRGVIRRIEPFSARRGAQVGMTVRITSNDFREGDQGQQVSSVFDLSMTAARFVPFRTVARYFDTEFRLSGIEAGFDLSGFAVEVVPGGER